MSELVRQRNGVKLTRCEHKDDQLPESVFYSYAVTTERGDIVYAGLSRSEADVAFIAAAFDLRPSWEKRKQKE